MKKAVFCGAAILLSATLAGAALLRSDSFSYPDGPLVTVSSGVWAHHSGSVSGQVMVKSGRVLLSETNTEDVNALLAGQPYPVSGATNVFYASFTVKFTVLPGSGGAYFAHFKDASTGCDARTCRKNAAVLGRLTTSSSPLQRLGRLPPAKLPMNCRNRRVKKIYLLLRLTNLG